MGREGRGLSGDSESTPLRRESHEASRLLRRKLRRGYCTEGVSRVVSEGVWMLEMESSGTVERDVMVRIGSGGDGDGRH